MRVWAMKPVCRALGCIFGGVVMFGALVRPVWAKEAVRTEARVEVTGSAISRLDSERALPVVVMTRQEIARTGAATVAELMRALPVVDNSEVFEQNALVPGQSGTSTIAMRGQYDDSVLVLLNGHRLPRNGIASATSGVGNAVDVNMIPLSAIERVEILPEGASAIYGADAVGGVVNFITRKDYRGFEARTGYGLSSQGDGGELSAGLTAGFGDYHRDRFNLLFSLDHFKREPIYAARRDISSSADFRHIGGLDVRSVIAPEGNVINSDGTFTPLRPCPADRVMSNGACGFDTNRLPATLQNGANRTQLMLLGSVKASETTRVSAELLYSHADNHFQYQPTGGYMALPDGRVFYGRFMQGGLREQDREAGLLQFGLGAEGQAGSFDWQVHYNYGESRVKLRGRNDFGYSALYEAVSLGQIDLTSESNDPALVDSLRISPEWNGLYAEHSLDAKLTGSLGVLAGGSADFAVGMSWSSEKRVDTPDAWLKAGEVLGAAAQQGVVARRNATALYAELDLPLVKNLTTQIAVRYDHYPTASKASTRLAMSYRPVNPLLFRASYTESFRMPGLNELYGGVSEGNFIVIGGGDPAQLSPAQRRWCAQQGFSADACNLYAYAIYGANPDLKPERGRTFSLGVVVEPAKGLSLGLDWWAIRKDDMVYRQTLDRSLQNGNWSVRDGYYYVSQLNVNAAKYLSSGMDVDLRWRIPVSGGAVVLRESLTRYSTQRLQQDADQRWYETLGIYGSPRWRNVASATYEQATWDATVAVRSTGGFADSDAFDSMPDNVRQVGAFEEVDVNVGLSAAKALRLSGGIKNLFDRVPPYSDTNATGPYSGLGYAELYSARGRFFYFNLAYAFN